jgi:4a-hydroxytetrahydrobiopterin dehydratase
MSALSEKQCIPCQGGVPPLPVEARKELLRALHADWTLSADQNQLCREYKYKDYKSAWNLVNKISELAEEQWHHPDIQFGWGYLKIQVMTHKIGSLVESDFILASKIDGLGN